MDGSMHGRHMNLQCVSFYAYTRNTHSYVLQYTIRIQVGHDLSPFTHEHIHVIHTSDESQLSYVKRVFSVKNKFLL